MKLRRRTREEPDINLTPLIDVVFLLLIFFMVTTTFRKETALDVSLPRASAVTHNSPAKLVIAIDAAGHYAVDGKALAANDPATVKAALTAALAGSKQHPLLEIRADGRTPHRAVVEALDAAGQLGLQRIAIAALPRPAGSP